MDAAHPTALLQSPRAVAAGFHDPQADPYSQAHSGNYAERQVIRHLGSRSIQINPGVPGNRYLFTPVFGNPTPMGLGMFDLAPWQGEPQSAAGANIPPNWKGSVRAVESGRLGFRAGLRFGGAGLALPGPAGSPGIPDEMWGTLARYFRCSLYIATWNTWPAGFGDSQGAINSPSGWLAKTGPELGQVLAGRGMVEVDLTRWAQGARFCSVGWMAWHDTVRFNDATYVAPGGALLLPSLHCDWQVFEGYAREPQLESWPSACMVAEPTQAAWPAPLNVNTLTRAHLVASFGAQTGKGPRQITAHGAGTIGVQLYTEMCYGGGWRNLIGPVNLAAGIDHGNLVTVVDYPTAANVYARLVGVGTATITVTATGMEG